MDNRSKNFEDRKRIRRDTQSGLDDVSIAMDYTVLSFDQPDSSLFPPESLQVMPWSIDHCLC